MIHFQPTSLSLNHFNSMFLNAMSDMKSNKSEHSEQSTMKDVDPNEQREALLNQKNNPFYIPCTDEYAISSKWWKEWCDFVNIEYKPLKEHMNENQRFNIYKDKNNSGLMTPKNDENETCEKLDSETPDLISIKSCSKSPKFDKVINENKNSESENLKLLNFQLAIKNLKNTTDTKEFQKLKAKIKTSYSILNLDDLYTRPGKIENKDIMFIQRNKAQLKPNLQEIYDYVTVDENSWKLLSSWYGFDHSIKINPS